jgi:pantothenate kinase
VVRDDLLARAARLTGSERSILGICGAPGSGKSTLATELAAGVGRTAVVVPMDGFHLHDDELARLGLSERKGAPETFDVAGYVALLRRLRVETEHPVYAPAFDRSRELALAGAITVSPEHRLVVTEGNYLLYDAPGWSDVRTTLDEVWFVETAEQTRIDRLVERHIANGRSREAAQRWASGSDQGNADLVARTRDVADLVVEVDEAT